MMPIVSIIVPIYNVGETLLRCLDSIRNQTFTDFEVVLIDDGSTDESGQIIDEYSKKDSRFKPFHKVNGGVASARQYGIEHAQGTYTIHADPDDWVEQTMLERLVFIAEEETADMVICDYYVDYKGTEKYMSQKPQSLLSSDVIDQLFGNLHGSLWNKLVRSSCYKNNNIQFANGINYCEDLLFNVKTLKYAKKVVHLPQAFYHYVQDDSGKSYTSYSNKKWLSNYEAFQNEVVNVAEELGKHDIVDKVQVQKLSGMIKHEFVTREIYNREKKYSFKELKKSGVSLSMSLLIKIADIVSLSLAQNIYKGINRIKL